MCIYMNTDIYVYIHIYVHISGIIQACINMRLHIFILYIEALNEERITSSNMEKKLRFFEEEILEVRTLCSLQIAENKLDSVKLKGQMRVICDNNNVSDIYNIFDIHTQKLIVENESLREKNLILESKKTEYSSLKNSNINESNDNNDVNFELDLTAIEIKKNAKLSSKFVAILNENINLKKKLDDVYGKERSYVLSQKLARDASRRLNVSHQESLRLKKELNFERTACTQLGADLKDLSKSLQVYMYIVYVYIRKFKRTYANIYITISYIYIHEYYRNYMYLKSL
jgi:hypothetical protein